MAHDLIEYADPQGGLHTIEPGAGDKVVVDHQAGYQVAASYGLEVDTDASARAIADAAESSERALYADPITNEGLSYRQKQARAKELGIPATGSDEELTQAIAQAEANAAQGATTAPTAPGSAEGGE